MYKSVTTNKITNTLMPKTLFWLRCILSKRVSDDTHRTSKLSPLAPKHLSLAARGLVPRLRNISVNNLVPGGDWSLHFGVCCKPLASQVILKVSNDTEITRTRTSSGNCHWIQRYSRQVMGHPTYSDEVSNLTVGCWLHTLDNAFFYSVIKGLISRWVGQMFICQLWFWKSGLHHLLPMYHVYFEVRIKMTTSSMFVIFF